MSSITVYRGTASGRVQESTVSWPDPTKAHQVTVRITHSGICGTDEHYKCQDMVVLGHEGVGIVESIGSSVVTLKVGDRVGWGYCHGSCLTCQYCDRGQELYCEKRQFYGFDDFDQGSFATYATWNEHFLFRIQESIPSAEAAPLCAGADVYSALRSAQVQWYHRVGVLGLGGLGHLAVQYASKMGCHVIVYSHSPGKEQAARNLGASDFQVLSDASTSPRAVDCLLLTGAQQPEWSQALSLVRRGGVISAVTVDSSDLRCSYGKLLMNAIRIQGSLPAAPNVQREMLSFSVLHGMQLVIEAFPFTEGGINEAMEKLRQGEMRYRGVLVMED
ncbi:ADH7-NADP(H)-dependent alcohol dehydrogenase [Fusarium tjaetaba]|uniref:ADH7-NADP(H)-dependent alcohol dehydrogenase n=1 Tax=Fusarium tjaetaba TaxID=1567544 RepID=A0A8H5QUF8_9HYPO|nr:ADH7-NADP(H)-dependent alcohol dehydrogenase [Fusarium tjaetaba]KAF5621074.1 ADH7-NADP(H)-dependent alcohol dehydrogenase [Fusarium tjaetaba]